MNKLRESFEYPIPFWFSPIFILSLIGFWMIFKWGFESTPEKWEFWKWVIDKTVYIGGILFVALLAQKVFNDNARNRENRERKIKAIESCMHECHDLYDTIINSTKSSMDTFLIRYNKAFAHYRKICGLSELYDLDLDSSLSRVANELKNFRAMINEKSETSGSHIRDWDEAPPVIPEGQEAFIFLAIGKAITNLKDSVTSTLKNAEISH